MANLMGNMADPGNALIGLIPFVGEARAATLLGRAGQRFLQGSAYGAAQTAATMPLVAEGQAAQGNDFTMGITLPTFYLEQLAVVFFTLVVGLWLMRFEPVICPLPGK